MSPPLAKSGGNKLPGKINRENKTLRAMVDIFCRRRHGMRGDICSDCRDLLRYAQSRLNKCPYGSAKPVCNLCPIHCYQPAMRERIREVMRCAGPRMLWRHPLLTIHHFLDGNKPGKKAKNS